MNLDDPLPAKIKVSYNLAPGSLRLPAKARILQYSVLDYLGHKKPPGDHARILTVIESGPYSLWRDALYSFRRHYDF